LFLDISAPVLLLSAGKAPPSAQRDDAAACIYFILAIS
jgi:hypothetical protein